MISCLKKQLLELFFFQFNVIKTILFLQKNTSMYHLMNLIKVIFKIDYIEYLKIHLIDPNIVFVLKFFLAKIISFYYKIMIHCNC